MLSLLLPVALAADPNPGYLLPGARPVPTDDHVGGGVTVGGAAVCTFGCGFGVYTAGSVWGAMAPDNRLVGEASVLGLDAAEGVLLLGFSARYDVFRKERTSLAPWVGTVWDPTGAAFDVRNETVYAAGLAVDHGWKRVTLDASVPLVVLKASDPLGLYASADANSYLSWPLGLSEVGFTYDAGGGHALRFAKTTLLPTVTWRMEKGPLWVEAGGGIWLLLNEVHAGVGATW